MNELKPTDLIHTPIPTNFVYPEIKPQDYKFGSGQLTGTPLRDDADWRDYLPPDEDQNIRGIESSACYIEASQHAISTIEEEQLGEVDNNYSARFNALLSNGTQTGGNPLAGADSIRHDGLIPDSLMPFGDDINSWGDFHSFKGVNEAMARAIGREYLGKKVLGYDVVFEKWEPVAKKYAKLRESLKYSPCPVSVTAWYEKDGIYYKPDILDDNHLVELVYIDEENHPYIRDTYAPYLKKLDANFNFDFGMRWSVEKAEEHARKIIGLLQLLVDAYKQLLALLTQQNTMEDVQPEPVKPKTPSEQIYETALSFLGTDASPRDKAPDYLACGESLTAVLKASGYALVVPNELSTYYIYRSLKEDIAWKLTSEPEAGCIIISPTMYGNRKNPNGTLVIPNGHAGIIGTDGKVMSNDSRNGNWTYNYTLESWADRYVKLGGYPQLFFKHV